MTSTVNVSAFVEVDPKTGDTVELLRTYVETGKFISAQRGGSVYGHLRNWGDVPV